MLKIRLELFLNRVNNDVAGAVGDKAEHTLTPKKKKHDVH